MDGRQKKRILIVDDEPELRELIVDALSDTGTIIQTAGSGSEAIELAQSEKPDIVITDLCLGDCSGLDVIDHLRKSMGDVSTVVITGKGDAKSLTEASQRRPLELMTKPLNIQRLRNTISKEITRLEDDKSDEMGVLDFTIEEDPQPLVSEQQLLENSFQLSKAYRSLSQRALADKMLINFQMDLIESKSDDDVFRSFFRAFVRKSGAVLGAVLVCDSNAELRVVGRFGVPQPDNLEFCRELSEPLVDLLLSTPYVQTIDAMDERELFDESIQRYLPGITVLAIPLIPAPGEMIGVIMLYRKGEQPFTNEDLELAQLIAFPTAVAVQRND
jgi:DNA-binding response OmpR family regulator